MVVWSLTTAKFYTLSPSTGICYSTYLALLFLTPGLWSLMAPASYVRRRQHILLGGSLASAGSRVHHACAHTV